MSVVQRKACDQCYKRKRKCFAQSESEVCLRCENLSLRCGIIRQQRRGGRPPKPELAGLAKGSLRIWDYALSQANVHEHDEPLVKSPSPTPVEEFYHQNDLYMIGSTFAKDFYQSVEICELYSNDLLKETFLALSSCLSWARFDVLPADQVDIKSGAQSVEKLRNVTINNHHDALAVLLLGQALAAFDSLVTSTGTISILRSSLALVRPWYADIASNRALEPLAIAPIFWDTISCLLHREVPVIQPLIGRPVIDRIAGLCTSLLPILYQLCVVSKKLKDGHVTESALDEIENEIRSWSPNISPCPKIYTNLEILSLNTQAEMYKTAILLLIHRLRYPLNQPSPDKTAQVLAISILETRENFFNPAGQDAKLQNTAFPLFLAILEIRVPPESLWDSATRLRQKPACVNQLSVFWRWYWEMRDGGFEGLVSDLIKFGPGLVPLV